MNTQNQDLEVIARNALDMVTRHGVNGILVDGQAIRRGLERGFFDQSAVDDAQVQYQHYNARNALDMVTRHGVHGTPVDRTALVYGVLNGVFEHRDIIQAQEQYKATHSK